MREFPVCTCRLNGDEWDAAIWRKIYLRELWEYPRTQLDHSLSSCLQEKLITPLYLFVSWLLSGTHSQKLSYRAHRWWHRPLLADLAPGGCVSSSCGSDLAAGWSSSCGSRSHEQLRQGSPGSQPGPVSAPGPLPSHSSAKSIHTGFKNYGTTASYGPYLKLDTKRLRNLSVWLLGGWQFCCY